MYHIIDTEDDTIVAIRHTFSEACKEAMDRNGNDLLNPEQDQTRYIIVNTYLSQ